MAKISIFDNINKAVDLTKFLCTKYHVLINVCLQQADFDMLLVNLRMDATYIKEGMNISWVSEVRTKVTFYLLI